MRLLIGAACVAVIAASGVYLSGEYRAYTARQEGSAALAAQIDAKIERERKYQSDLEDAEIAEDKTHINAEECKNEARQVAYLIDTGQVVTRSQSRRVIMCQEANLVAQADMVNDLKDVY